MHIVFQGQNPEHEAYVLASSVVAVVQMSDVACALHLTGGGVVMVRGIASAIWEVKARVEKDGKPLKVQSAG